MPIGDVGFYDSTDMSFTYLFNIFHDAGSPKMVPDNFIPIQPQFDEWEVKQTPGYFPKGAIIASEGVWQWQETLERPREKGAKAGGWTESSSWGST